MAGIRAACFFLTCLLVLAGVQAQQKLRVCAEDGKDTCKSLKSMSQSPVICEEVQDAADCAIKLAEGKADFGVFTADEIVLTNHFYPVGIEIAAVLKHQERYKYPFQFQSVAIVPKNYVPSENGFGALVGANFCHPGFSESQSWNHHVLKYFEQKVMNKNCRRDVSVAENEIINVRDFFKKSCRPGQWVVDEEFDKELKRKYPELCELCDDKETCSYDTREKHGHMAALKCLTSGRGQVAYVAHEYAETYFATLNSRQDFQYLCLDGTVMPIDASTPCTWYKQPWNAILTREDKAGEVVQKIEEAGRKIERSSSEWQQLLGTLLFKDEDPFIYNNDTSLAHYLSAGRDVEDIKIPKSECGNEIRWCTTNELETNKCNWTSAAALTLGIKPAISCVPSHDNFECFDRIKNNHADIMAIDSNYGDLARKVYSLSPVMYCDSPNEDRSVVVGVVRNSNFPKPNKLEEIKDSSVCFPEYGGIAWLSFINVMRDNRLISKSCNYPAIVSNFIHAACTPGFIEASHFVNKVKPRLASTDLNKLCELCPAQRYGEKCEANTNNTFFGDEGALRCLKEQSGNIAVLEIQNLRAFDNRTIDPSQYRILCKNGSLADRPGFKVDDQCAWSVTIDSEVISRRKLENVQSRDFELTLQSVEKWLGNIRQGRRPIHIYGHFNATKNLLFKDSTSALVSPKSQASNSVSDYKAFFEHVDKCSGTIAIVAVMTLVLINFIVTRLI